MTNDLKSLEDIKSAQQLELAIEAAYRYAYQSRAESTWRTYEGSWRLFEKWCESMSLAALPAQPKTVAAFIAFEADKGLAPSTLSHRLAAIRFVHLRQELPSPHDTLPVKEVMQGIRRWHAKNGKQPNKKAPAVDEIIKKMIDQLDTTTLRGERDRALLLYGFAGALRRSELVSIDVEHISSHEKGHLLTIPISKGDQEGNGQVIGILAQTGSKYCPVAAIQSWIINAHISTGPVFRPIHRGGKISDKRLGGRTVADIIKNSIYQMKDPTLNYENFSGHSLRRGFLTSAGKNNSDLLKLISQSRHKRVDTVLGYIDDPQRFDNHAATSLLLTKDP